MTSTQQRVRTIMSVESEVLPLVLIPNITA